MPDNFNKGRSDFTVPVTNGNYAPEAIIFPGRHVSISVMVEALPASATIELWLLKAGLPPSSSVADYVYSGKNFTATGHTMVELASWSGLMLRAKSGGTAGTATVSAHAD